MPESVLNKVLIVGGPDKSYISPPKFNILEKHPSKYELPFDPRKQRKIKKYLWDHYGEGYFRVYEPGHAERMRTYFKGWIKEDEM